VLKQSVKQISQIGRNLMAKEKKKARKVLAVPIYVLVEEDSLVLPTAKVEIVRPSELPEEGNFFVVTAEGLHVAKDTKIVKALVPVDSIETLASFHQAAKLRLPKIPRIILARAKVFFQKVYQEHKTESEVMLLYRPEDRIYDLWCPKQEVSAAGVNYKMSEELADTPKEWQNVGTIHSHADFSAYHSSTDVNDEGDGQGDGVHITIGHVNHEEFSLSCSVAIGGHRWKCPTDNLLLGIGRATKEVKRYSVNVASFDEYFALKLTDEEQVAMDGPIAKQIEEDWMPRVENKTYNYNTNWQGGHYAGYQQSTVYTRDEESFFEDEEDGEWQFQGGKWVFIANEAIDEMTGEVIDEADESMSPDFEVSAHNGELMATTDEVDDALFEEEFAANESDELDKDDAIAQSGGLAEEAEEIEENEDES